MSTKPFNFRLGRGVLIGIGGPDSPFLAHCGSSRPSALWMEILHPTGNIFRFANVGSLLSNPALHRTGHFFSGESNLVLHKTAQFKEVVMAKFPTLDCT
uniref:Uncharacterized protein n=2 Tax=mine drainage metagenome TaxID=410659 RepID=E6QW55_9ZZZZ